MTEGTIDRGYVEANARSRERLARLAPRSDIELARALPNGWTVAAVLAHLAFWDAWAAARWDRYEEDGSVPELPELVEDLANRANMLQWLALPPPRTLALATEAAERLDARLEKLSDEAVAYAVQAERPELIDRSLHREPHLDEIEKALPIEAAPEPDEANGANEADANEADEEDDRLEDEGEKEPAPQGEAAPPTT